MNRVLSVAIMLLCPAVLFAQAQKFPSVFPVSPDAAAYAQYTSTPVNMNTGIPNISVPLYNIQTNGITIPISLSYHPYIKVNQVASSVGLGWSLNGGGCITRMTKGKVDLKKNNTMTGITEIDNTTLATVKEVYLGYKDSEPDIFAFNFGGYAGQFFFKGTQAYVLDEQILRIEADSNLTQFIITTPDGVKYTFGSTDGVTYCERTSYKVQRYNLEYPIGDYESEGLTNLHYNNTSSIFNDTETESTTNGYISAWMLKSITLPNSLEVINFGYALDNLEMYTELSEQTYSTLHPDDPNNFEGPKIYRSFSINTITQLKLNSIVWSNGSVSLQYGHNRQDMATFTGDPTTLVMKQVSYVANTSNTALTNMQIRDENNVLLKGFEFKYGYYNSRATSALQKRLKLNSVTEYSNAIKLPPYEFSYENTDLPSVLSNCQDLWGFYNGKDLTGMLTRPDADDTEARLHKIPKLVYKASQTINPWTFPSRYRIPTSIYSCGSLADHTVYGSDVSVVGRYCRSMNTYALSGVLETITYPTGGQSKYIYTIDTAYYNASGGNWAGAGGGIKIYQIYTADVTGSATLKTYKYSHFGKLMCLPQFTKQFYYPPYSGGSPQVGLMISSNNLNSITGPAVLFDTVIEYQSGIAADQPDYTLIGRAEYVYDNICAAGENIPTADATYFKAPILSAYGSGSLANLDCYPYNSHAVYDWNRGQLKSKKIYTNTNKLIQEELYTYQAVNTSADYAYSVSLWNSEYYKDPSHSGTPESSGLFYVSKYFYSPGWKPMTQYKKRAYNSGNTNYLETTTNYTYSDSTHLVRNTTETNSDGSQKVTKKIYIGDMPFLGGSSPVSSDNGHYAEVIQQMVYGRFMKSLPLATSVYLLNGETFLLSSTLTLYDDFNSDQKLPSKILALEIQNPLSSYTDVDFDSGGGDYELVYDSHFKLQQQFLRYDTRANMLEMKDRNKGIVSYKWGYHQMLPVAEFINAHDNDMVQGDEAGHLNFESGDVTDNVQKNDYWTFDGVDTNTANPYSGIYCGKITSGADNAIYRSFAPTRQNQAFKFSAWIKTSSEYSHGKIILGTDSYNHGSESSAGDQVAIGNTDGEWKYVEVIYDLGKYKSDNDISSEESVVLKAILLNTDDEPIMVDDIRFCPVVSSVTTYTYNPVWDSPTSISDARGNVTHYGYDQLGRLILVKDQYKDIKKTLSYLYKQK